MSPDDNFAGMEMQKQSGMLASGMLAAGLRHNPRGVALMPMSPRIHLHLRLEARNGSPAKSEIPPASDVQDVS